jgi:hypothetical protein
VNQQAWSVLEQPVHSLVEVWKVLELHCSISVVVGYHPQTNLAEVPVEFGSSLVEA